VAGERSGEWWAEVAHAFQSHVRDETYFLDQYEQLALTVDDPGTRFLLDLILEDERRHHELFERLAAAAVGAEGVEGTPPPPRLSADDARSLLSVTERFLDAEREDKGTLRDLHKLLGPARDETLWQLVVDLMAHDTAKHVAILEYLRDRMRRAIDADG
jgi:rubrerythrin